MAAFLTAAFLFPSCKKEDLPSQLKTPAAATPDYKYTETADAIYYFTVDGKEINEADFNAQEESFAQILITDSEPVTGKSIFHLKGFTTNEGYIKYGEEHNLPFALNVEIEQHLAKYAEESGAIAYEERTGEVPEEFMEYAYAYMNEMGALPTSRAQVIIYENNCTGTGTGNAAFVIGGFNPKMPSGFDDDVERADGFSIVGSYNKIYTRKWFRTKIHTCTLRFNEDLCMEGPLAGLANRASSWIVLGL